MTVIYSDSQVVCLVKDQALKVGATIINLSRIRQIRSGSSMNVILDSGESLSGPISGFRTVNTRLGSAPVILDLQAADDVKVENLDAPVRSVGYRIIARRHGRVVGTAIGRLTITGVQAAAAQSPPAVELFVCSFETHEIKRYDGNSGAFLSDFAIGNGIQYPHNAVFGTDGQLYVSSGSSSVVRFDGKSGQFIDVFASGNGLNNATGLAFGPDGNLYVGSAWNSSVKRFDGRTGAFLDDFVPPGSGGLDVCGNLTFGPDGNLYVISLHSHMVKRYYGGTGAFLSDFASGNGLRDPGDLIFGRDGNLYVTSSSLREVKRFDGNTGAFIDNFVAAGSGGLLRPGGVTFGPNGDLYVSDNDNSCVKRFDGRTGSFIEDLVAKKRGGLNGTCGLTFRLTMSAQSAVRPDSRRSRTGSGSHPPKRSATDNE